MTISFSIATKMSRKVPDSDSLLIGIHNSGLRIRGSVNINGFGTLTIAVAIFLPLLSCEFPLMLSAYYRVPNVGTVAYLH
jgi:hypothetical protein